MSRSQSFINGMGTGYIAIIVNIIFTLFSVRLALIYLGKEQFGLWALALQISGYMGLLELGISSAISRFLADHKDDLNGGEYGSLLLTGGIIFILLGSVIAILGALFSFYAPILFNIPSAMASEFRWVLVILTSLSGFSVATRALGGPLWAFQRMDISNLLSIMTLVVNFGALWLGFRAGYGIYSLAYANILTVILSPVIFYMVCSRNGYYPTQGCWGRPQWRIFKNLFSFGKDVLLLSIGSQLVNASQVMILSRLAGLDAAATFSIGTKFYSMGQQFAGKILENSSSGLTEIFIRGENGRFNARFWNVVSITSFLSTIGAIGLIVWNQQLISIWTSGVIHWSFGADMIVAVLLIATSLSRCFIGIFGMVGDLGRVRYIYFVEGCLFIAIALISVKHFGVIGVLSASLIAHISVTTFLSMRVAATWLDSMSPISPLVRGIIGILAAVAIVSISIKTFSVSSIVSMTLSLLLVLFASAAAWIILLSFDTKSYISAVINRLKQ